MSGFVICFQGGIKAEAKINKVNHKNFYGGRTMKNQKHEQGFTLIEIIIVLVLLGILAATAVPKFFDLQEAARARSALAAVAELQARVNMTFADSLLQGQSCTTARTAADGVTMTGTGNDNWKITLGKVSDDGKKMITEIQDPTGTSVTINTITKYNNAKAPYVLLPQCSTAVVQ